MDEVDILVVGGGVAGLTAAAVLASAGHQTLCIDAAPAEAGARDSRTTAFLRPAVELLTEAGVWDRLSGATAPLDTMRLIDAGGEMNEAREIADFHAAEISEPPFGWNVANRDMRQALIAQCEALLAATLAFGVSLESLTPRRACQIARLSDGRTIRARLIVGADGRNSAVRDIAGIGAKRTSYGQKALVFTVAHDEPHQGVSTEIHRTGGPFTLVPLPDADGPRSSIVWMETAGEAMRLAALSDAEFEQALNERSLDVLGPLRAISPRAAWPIISLIAHRLTAPHIALVAEAAHVVPPIGAQGLNMSLADIAALRDGIGDDPGAADSLAAYQRRWPELAARVAGIDTLNRAAMAGAQPIRDLRRAGLGLIARARPVRQTAMRMGLGVRDTRP
jgi:2-octaprenyl-6-methoxyphenol hydroxylase